eukprot:20952-Heterococcus_DN1.PRE.4
MAENSDVERCHLIGGTYANILQLVLAMAALSGLLIKRGKEVPQRPIKVWLYDVSKQGFGSIFIHFSNIFIAILLSDMSERDGSTGGARDECALYFVQFVLDMSIGLVLLYCLIHIQELVALRWHIPSLAVSGDYGTPAKFTWYWHQLCVYMAMLLLVKLVVSVVVIAADATLSTISRWLFSPLKKYPALELTIVMIVCPYILNGIQFWLIDELLMSSKPAPQQQGSNSSGGTTLPKSKYGHLSHDIDDDSNSSTTKTAKRRLDGKHIIREPSWVNPKASHSGSAVVSDSSSVGTPNFSSMRGNSIDSNDDYMPQYAHQELV